MLKHLGPIAATVIVILFLLVSALPLMHWFETEGRDAALAESRARWEELGIADYRMTVEMRCDCGVLDGVPVNVTVRDGAAARQTGGDLQNAFLPSFPDTVPALFAAIDDAIAGEPDMIAVTYDEAYGYPAEINIDLDEQVPGDETRILVSAFDPRPVD